MDDPALNLKCMTMSDWIEAWSKDKIVVAIIKMYKVKELQKGKETDNQEMRQFLKQRSKLFLRNGILYCKNDTQEIDHPDRNTMQLVLPESFRTQTLKACHDDLGHLGVETTLDLLRDWFYWPGMTEDMTRHIRQCERCLGFKASSDRASMENVESTYPMEVVHMDYLMTEANEGGKDIHIWVTTDHFTW